MAWTTAEEQLITSIMAPELQRRLDNNQTSTIAMLFDPDISNAATNFLKNRLNALKVDQQADLAALPAQTAATEAAINAKIALIDAVLAQLP